MKKCQLGLAAVGLTGILASCGVTVTNDSGYYGDYNPNSSVHLNSLTNYSTNRQLATSVTDQNGNTIAAGTSIICRNWDTDVSFTVNWNGYLDTVGFQFKGHTTGNYVNTDTYSVSNPNAGSANATFTLNSGMAPLNIKNQSIIVVPRVDVLGYTYVRAQGTDGNGYASNIVETNSVIPVMNCYSS